MSPASVVPAAGCVVWRRKADRLEVALVHRPKYDDWSFPKGKVDSGEAHYAAAVREVEEETGLRVALGPRLSDQTYDITGGQRKVVQYWAGRAADDADLSRYKANAEIDAVRWYSTERARKRLTYKRDVVQLEDFLAADTDTWPLLVVRHAHARSRKDWRGPDGKRPLQDDGKKHAKELIRLFSAYAVAEIVSSDAVRCVDTVLPYLNASRAAVSLDPALSQDAVDEAKLDRRITDLLAARSAAVACSHRPVLPRIFEALDLVPVPLAPGGVVVAHRRDGKVVSTEIYNN